MTTQRRLQHLLVLENGRLAGIVSIGDLVKKRLDEMAIEASFVRNACIARR